MNWPPEPRLSDRDAIALVLLARARRRNSVLVWIIGALGVIACASWGAWIWVWVGR